MSLDEGYGASYVHYPLHLKQRSQEQKVLLLCVRTMLERSSRTLHHMLWSAPFRAWHCKSASHALLRRPPPNYSLRRLQLPPLEVHSSFMIFT